MAYVSKNESLVEELKDVKERGQDANELVADAILDMQ